MMNSNNNQENTIQYNAVLINDTPCEKALLGSMLNYEDAYLTTIEYLDEDCFYNEDNKAIWKACTKVADNGDPINPLTVFGELQKAGSPVTMDMLIELSMNPRYSQWDVYAKRLSELSTRRKLMVLGIRIMNVGASEVNDIEEARQKAIDEIQSMESKSDGLCTMIESSISTKEIVKQNVTKGVIMTGTPTGLQSLDNKGGLHSTDLIIIAGETSQGKTSLALSITHNAIKEGAKIAFYSMEMTKEQLTARLWAYETGISSSKILYSPNLNSQELQAIDDAQQKLMPYAENLIFDDRSTSNIDTILISIRTVKMKYDIDGVVIDYLQILNVNMKNTNKEQAMGDIARRLKDLAKELNIWIIALSQLNRDRNDPVPNLNRLRDSGQIAEAADVVMFVYRAEYYNRQFPEPFQNVDAHFKAMIDVAKGRNIGVFKFLCGFESSLTHFTNDFKEPQSEDPFKDVETYDDVPY